MAANSDVEITIGAQINGLMSKLDDAMRGVSSASSNMSASIQRGMHDSQKSMEGFASGLNKIQSAFQLFGEVMAVGFIGDKLIEMGKRAAEFGDEIERASQKTGLSTEKLQELRFAAQMSDVSAEMLDKSMRKLSKAMVEGQVSTSLSARALEAVGIKANELKDMKIEDALGRIADAFHNSEDGAAKMAVAQQLLGKAGAEWIPMLNKGSAGIAEFEARAKELGIVIDKANIEKMAALDNQMKELRATMEANKTQMASSLVPAFSSISNAMLESTKDGGLLRDMFDALGTVLKFLTEIGIHVAATFEIVGKTIGAGMAMAVAAAHGNFSEIKNIYQSLQSDLDDINKKELASVQALYKGTAAAKSGAATGGGNKSKLSFTPHQAGGSGGEMQAWKTQLERKHDLEQDYFKSSLADDMEFWQQKLVLTKAGSKDRIAVEHELHQLRVQQAHQQFASDIEAMKAQQQAARANGVERIQIAGEMAAKIGATYGLESKEYKAALREMEKAAEEHQKELNKLADMRVNREKEHALAMLEMEKEHLQSRKDLGQISDQQEIQSLMQLEDQKYQIELDALEKKKELIQDDVVAQQQAMDTILKLKEQHDLQMTKLDTQMALASKKNWDSVMQPITSAFDTSIKGMILGTQTFQRAMANIGQSILGEFVSKITKMVASWLAGEMAKTQASAMGAAARGGIEKTASVASLATSAGTNLKEIANAAWVAAANVYKSIAAIPYVGPFLAPAAAIAAGAAVIGFGKSIMSAEGGYDIPTGINPITQLHQREMVLPAEHADTIRAMGAGGAGNAMNFHFNGPTDKRGIEKWFKDNASAMPAALRQLRRNFTPVT